MVLLNVICFKLERETEREKQRESERERKRERERERKRERNHHHLLLGFLSLFQDKFFLQRKKSIQVKVKAMTSQIH